MTLGSSVKRRALLAMVIVFLCASAANSSPQQSPRTSSRWSFTADMELSSALLSSLVGGDNDWHDTVAFAARLGAQKGHFNMFAFVEYGFFGNPTHDQNLENTLLNTGAGAQIRYFDNRMVTMLSVGPSILLTDSFQNDKGTTGLFVELRPAGFFIPFRRFNIQIYPITIAWIMPIMKNIPLVYLHYRTAFSVGGTF